MITLVTLTLSSFPPPFLATLLTVSVSNILFNFEFGLERVISSSLCLLFLAAKFVSDNLPLGGGLGGSRSGAGE
jgi:hypothetical protein